MKLFISWSGEKSKEIAAFLYESIPSVLQHINPWVSFKDLDRDLDDYGKIFENIHNSDTCLLILTPEALKNSPWVIFEAGMFHGKGKKVIVLLCGGITHNHLGKENHPLRGSHVYPNRESMNELFKSLNESSKKPIIKKHYSASLKSNMDDFINLYTRLFKNDNDSIDRMHLEKHLANLMSIDEP